MVCNKYCGKLFYLVFVLLFVTMITGSALADVAFYAGGISGNVQQSFKTNENVYLYLEAPETPIVFAYGIIRGNNWLRFLWNAPWFRVSDNLWRWKITNAKPGNARVTMAVFANGFTPIHFTFPVVDETLNLLSLHDPDSMEYDNDCTKCHGTKLRDWSLDLTIPPFHNARVSELHGDNCTVCHTSVDLLQQSAGNLRRNVAVDVCIACHGESGPGKQFYQ